MSIKYNGKTIAGNYKTQIISVATTSQSGTIRIATEDEVQNGVNESTAITPKHLSNKVDKEIGKSLISDTEIQRLSNVTNYDDAEVKTLINNKQNKLIAGKNVTLTTDEQGGTTTIDVSATEVLTDNTTIIQDDNNIITAIGIKTKSDGFLHDWVGTQEAYNTDYENGKITEDTQCIIIDDEQEITITPELNIPTKISELANDSNFTTKTELEQTKEELTELINNQNALEKTFNTNINISSTNGSSITYINSNNENDKAYLKFDSDNIKFSNDATTSSEKILLHEGNLMGIIKDGDKFIVDKGDDYIPPQATNVESGIIRVSTDEEFKLGENKNTSVTPYQISNYGTDFLSNNGLITNCTINIPQNIVLEYINSTLILKSGSVIICPNGLEEDGATRKFNYIKIEEDIITDGVSWDGQCYIFVNADKSLGIVSVSQCVSGEVAPTSTTPVWYDTKNNLIKKTEDFVTWTDSKASLPIGLVLLQTTIPYIKSLNQVFNGIGYMGSAIWVDKDIEGLIPNGINKDGSLKNIKFKKQKLSLVDYNGISFSNYYLWVGMDEIISAVPIVYNKIESGSFGFFENDNIIKNPNGEIVNAFKIGIVSVNNSVFRFLKLKPIEIAHNQDVDGNWIFKSYNLISSNTTINSGNSISFDLSDYLPQDENLYEIILTASGLTSNTELSIFNCIVNTDLLNNVNLMRCRTTASYSSHASGNANLIIGPLRTLTIYMSSGSSDGSQIDALSIRAYRKVR